MGCKHNWQITHSNNTYPYWCTKCGKRTTGVNYRKSNKTIPIVAGVISVMVAGMFLTNSYIIPTNTQIPPSNISPPNSSTNSNPPIVSNPITYTGCTVVSNGFGQYKISCLNQDSITCNSDPAMQSGIHQNAILTINGNACTVEFSDNDGNSITWDLSLSPIVSNTQTRANPVNSVIEPTKNAIGTIQNSIDQASKTIVKNTQNITHIVPNVPAISNPLGNKPSIDVPTLENKIHDLINVRRTQNHLAPLVFDPKLGVIARAHSQDMVDNNYFEHDSPDGLTFSDRYKQAGYTCEKRYNVSEYSYSILEGGENIFQNNLYNSYITTNGVITSYDWNNMDELASSTVNGWMGSTGHRENILNSMFDTEGIGVAISKDSKVYITEDFC